MKKKFITMALALVLPFTVAAASNEKCDKGWHHGNKVEHLTKELGLSVDQKSKLETIFNENKERFKALREERHKQIEGVLTKEQLAKYDALKKQRHEEWEKKRQAQKEKNPAANAQSSGEAGVNKQ